MPNTIDNSVVEMSFDNKNFEKNIKQSMASIERLNQSIDELKSANHLKDLDVSIKNTNLNTITRSVESLSEKFSAFGIIGVTALQNITTAAMRTGSQIISSIIKPISSGGLKRALNIEQARFQFEGLGMDIEATMEDANYAVDGTAYSLDAAARVAGQLGATGMRAGEDMKRALRGVAGVAAMTSSEYEDIGNIFVTVAGNGRLMGDQLRQLSYRGINASATLSKYLGITEEEVRKMVSAGKIDFQTFANAMDDAFGEHAKDANKTFTGAMSNVKAALSRIGAEFATPYIENMRDVLNAIRPWLNNLKTALGPIVTDVSNIMIGLNKRVTKILGDERWVQVQTDAVEIFRNVLYSLYTIFAPISRAWKEVFPKSALDTIQGMTKSLKDFTAGLHLSQTSMANLRDTFKGIFSILKIVGDIFSNLLKIIFPFTKGAGSLLDVILMITGGLGRLTTGFANLIERVGGIKIVFGGAISAISKLLLVVRNGLVAFIRFISQFDAVKIVVGSFATVILGLLKGLSLLIGSLTKLKDISPSEVFKRLQKTVVDLINKFKDLKIVQVILAGASKALNVLGSAINKLKSPVSKIGNALKTFVTSVKNAFANNNIIDFFKDLGKSISTLFSSLIKFLNIGGIPKALFAGKGKEIVNTLKNIAKALKDFVSSLDFSKIAVAAFSVAIIALVIGLARMFNSIASVGTGIKKAIKQTSESINGVLYSLSGIGRKQKSFLMEWAKAIAIFAGSLALLTLVDSDKLLKAVGVLSIMAGEMLAMQLILSILNKFKIRSDFQNFGVGVAAFSAGIILIAGAFVVLNKANMDGALKKVGTLALLMAAMGTVVALMSKVSPKIAKGSLFMLAFASSTSKVAKALVSLNDLDSDSLNDKIMGLFVAMSGLALLAKGVGSIRLTSVAGLLLLTASLGYIVPKLQKIFSKFNPSAITTKIENSVKTFVILASLIAVMGYALDKVSGSISKLAVGLIGISVAILLLSKVAKSLKKADLNTDEISEAKSFITTIIGLFSLLTVAAGTMKNATFGNTSGIGVMALGLSVSILLLAQAAKSLSKIGKTGDWFKGVLAIDSMLALFALIVKANADAGKINTIGLSVAIAGIVLLAGEMVILSYQPWDKILAAAGSMALVIAAFSLCINAIGGVSKGKVNTTSIVAIASIMASLGAYLIIAAKYDWKSIVTAAGAMDVCLIALNLVIKTVSKSSGLKDTKVKSLVSVSLALVVLGGSLALLSNQDWEGVVLATISMGVAMYAFTKVIKVISGASGLKDEKVKSLVVVAASLLILGGSLALLASLNDWEGIGAALVAMASTMGMFVLIIKTISSSSGLKDTKVKSLAAAAVSMLAIGVSLRILADNYDWKSIGAATLGMITTIGAFVLVLNTVSKMNSVNISSIVALGVGAASMLLIAGSLRMLADNYDWKSILAASGAMSTAVIALAAAIGLLGKLNKATSNLAASGSLLIASFGIIALGEAIEKFSQYKDGIDAMIYSITAVSAALLVLGAVAGHVPLIMAGMAVAAAAILAVGEAFNLAGQGIGLASEGLAVLLPVLKDFSAIDLITLAYGLSTLSGSLLSIGACGSTMTVAGTAMSLFGMGIKAFVDSSGGLEKAIDALDYLSKISIEKDLSKYITELGSSMLVLGLAGSLLPTAGVGLIAVGKGLYDVSMALTLLSKTNFKTVGDDLNAISEGILAFTVSVIPLSLIGAGLLISAAGIGELSIAFGQLASIDLNKLSETLPVTAESMLKLGVAGMALNSAISGYIGTSFAIAALGASIDQFGKQYTDSMEKIEATYQRIFAELAEDSAKAGIDSVRGLSESINSNLDTVLQSGRSMADMVLEGIRETGGWHSPWKRTLEAGQDAMRGLQHGISDETRARELKKTWWQVLKENILKVLEDLKKQMSFFGAGLIDAFTGGMNKANDSLKNNFGIDLSDITNMFANPDINFEETLQQYQEELEKQLDPTALLESANIDLSESYGAIGASATKAKSALETMTEMIAGQIDIFSEFNMQTEITADQMLTNMRSQLQGVTEWASNLQLLAERGIDQGLLAKLSELGPQGYEKVAAFVQMTDEQLAEAGYLFTESLSLPQNAANQVLNSYAIAGQFAAQGFASGINGYSSESITAATNMGLSSLNALNNSLAIASPSKKTEQSGMYVDMGLSNGIAKNADLPLMSVGTLCTSIINTFKVNLPQSKFVQIGANIVFGVANGINANASTAITAAVNMAVRAYQEVCNTLEIGSPSKRFWNVGRWSDEGMANGLIDNAYLITNAASDVTEKGVKQFNSAVSNIQKAFSLHFIEDPVIRPALDLSNVINGANKINNMFENKRLGVSVEGSTTSEEDSGTKERNVIFNQYNTSPKALSRIDIYRQTSNIVSRAAERIK